MCGFGQSRLRSIGSKLIYPHFNIASIFGVGMNKNYKFSAIITISSGLFLSNLVIAAEPVYPVKPIRFVLPVSPGGGVDAVGRLVGQELTNALKQQVIVDHRPGGGGNLAAEIVANATPDGYTLLLNAANHAINPSLYKNLSYDPVRDFSSVSKLSDQPYLFVLGSGVPAKDVKEFVALAKSKQGSMTYASVGAGLLSHLSMELLKHIAKFEAVHVPYKGAAPAFLDVLAGRVDAFFPTITSGLPHVKSGRVRAIAVTSAKRASIVPEVPTLAEQGYPGYEVLSWYALFAPAKTSPQVIKTLNTEVVKLLASQVVAERMAANGVEPVSSTPAELTAYVKSEKEKWEKVIKQSGITAN